MIIKKNDSETIVLSLDDVHKLHAELSKMVIIPHDFTAPGANDKPTFDKLMIAIGLLAGKE